MGFGPNYLRLWPPHRYVHLAIGGGWVFQSGISKSAIVGNDQERAVHVLAFLITTPMFRQFHLVNLDGTRTGMKEFQPDPG